MTEVRLRPGSRQALGQRGRERRVAALAVERDVARLRRVGDERADARLHLRQPLADGGRARAHGARQVARQRIVAAGIEEHDVGLALALELHLLEHEVDARRPRSRDRARPAGWRPPAPGSCGPTPAARGRHRRTRPRPPCRAHARSRAPWRRTPACSRSSPRITSKPTSVSALAMSPASFTGLGSAVGVHVGRVAHDQGDALVGGGGEDEQQVGDDRRKQAVTTRHGQAPF